MAKKEAPETLDIFDYYGPTARVATVRRLQEGEYISGAELAAILEANPDKVLPLEFRQYLVRFLLGKVKAKRGRKPRSEDLLGKAQLLLLWIYYDRILKASQLVVRCIRRKAKASGKRPHRQEPAHQLALRYIQQHRKLFPHMTRRALHNRISSQKKLRN